MTVPRASLLRKPLPRLTYSPAVSNGPKIKFSFRLRMLSLAEPALAPTSVLTLNRKVSARNPIAARNVFVHGVAFWNQTPRLLSMVRSRRVMDRVCRALVLNKPLLMRSFCS